MRSSGFVEIDRITLDDSSVKMHIADEPVLLSLSTTSDRHLLQVLRRYVRSF